MGKCKYSSSDCFLLLMGDEESLSYTLFLCFSLWHAVVQGLVFTLAFCTGLRKTWGEIAGTNCIVIVVARLEYLVILNWSQITGSLF